MRFSPQRRAFFRHPNFKKCSETDVFCTLSLQNVLLATAACNVATSELQKVLRNWRVLYTFTSKCAFRHSTVHFLMSPLSTALTGLLFDWPDTEIIEKTQHFATSLTFGADVSSFFWLSRYIASSFCWLDYSTLLFNCPYCRKFLFKLPSINNTYICMDLWRHIHAGIKS